MTDVTEDQAGEPGTRSAFVVGVVAAAAGFLIGVVLLVVLGGNPLSDTNEVVYREVTIANISADQVCWSERPDQRDSPQQCAILTLDPQVQAPSAGELVTIGLVQLRPPGDGDRQQVVHIGAVAEST